MDISLNQSAVHLSLSFSSGLIHVLEQEDTYEVLYDVYSSLGPIDVAALLHENMPPQ